MCEPWEAYFKLVKGETDKLMRAEPPIDPESDEWKELLAAFERQPRPQPQNSSSGIRHGLGVQHSTWRTSSSGPVLTGWFRDGN